MPNSKNVEIHCFAKASQKAYGAVVYLQVQNYDQVSVNVISFKTRVVPVKRVTLSYLEMLGALFAARVGSVVKKVIAEFQQKRGNYFMDKEIRRTWKSFVANRVQEIQGFN